MIRHAHVAALSLLLVGLSAHAETSKADAERQRAAVQVEISKVQQALERDQARGNKLQTELRAIERKAAKLARENRQLASDEAKQQTQRDQLNVERKQLEQSLRGEHQALAQQLRSAYLAGHSERLSLVLSQDDPALLGRVMSYHDYVNNARLAQIERVTERSDKLAHVETQLQIAATQLQRLRRRQNSVEATLKQQRASRQSLLKKSQAKVRSGSDQLQGLKTQESQLQTLLSNLREALKRAPPAPKPIKPSSLSKQKGKLHWPVSGRVLHNYGESRLDGKMRWNGIQIAAKRGAPVKAIAPGQVVYSDWLGRHGLMVIIDHGHGYLSLYGQGETSLVEVGQSVNSGDTIATAGDSGGQTNPGLYFEIRHKGNQRDPRTWCKRKARP